MTDSSWDNSGLPPEKRKMGTGMKVMVGCGAALGLLLVTCVAVPAILGGIASKDPEAFERRIESWAEGFMKEDWARTRKVVDALQTDEDARLLYTQSPALASRYPTADAFLKAVQDWRPRLKPLPAELPDTKHHQLSVNKVFGATHLRYTYTDGTRLRVSFDRGALTDLSAD